MGKHTDKLGTFDDFRAPWETESGSDAEIEKPKLKRYLFNLKAGEAKALDAKADADEALEKAKADLEAAKEEAADANGAEAQKKIDRLEKKVEDLTAERDKLVSDKEVADLRSEALKDIDPKYHEWIKGETQEELDAAVEKFKETFGIEGENSADDDEGDGDEPQVRTKPRTLRNPNDPKPALGADKEYDFDKVADEIVGNSIFG